MLEHSKKIMQLQRQIKEQFLSGQSQEISSPIALQYHSDNSNTTRSKSYKNACNNLDFRSLNRVIQIDTEKRIALVEPRVTMEALVKATLPYGLTVPVIPEFKGITVGGAIMGGAAESSSHRWGLFNDVCTAFEIICGDGTLMRVSPDENPDIFHGISGSYGSLGALVLAEIKLIPAKKFVHIRYHFFSRPSEAIDCIRKLSYTPEAPDFLDGIVFAKNLAVVIEGAMQSEENLPQRLPHFKLNSISSEWYYQHVKKLACEAVFPTYEEKMTLQEYLFRYDQGAFWMGAYLLKPTFLNNFIKQGLFNLGKKPHKRFNEAEIQKLHKIQREGTFLQTLLRPLLTSQQLWKFLHKAEKWVLERIVLQDFCIPEANATHFLEELSIHSGIFPLWLCPIKGTRHPQIFAPHLLTKEDQESHFINIGVYGIPSTCTPTEQITSKLEQKAKSCGGRKVLYSQSHYTQNEFWEIYCHKTYDKLRTKTSAKKIWHEITEKVLSQ